MNLICDGSHWQYPALIAGSTGAGGTAASCATATAGAIEWTGTVFQGCNGTSWGSLGSGGSLTWPLAGAADAVGAPDYAWSGHTTTGLYYNTGIGFAVAGSNVGTMTTTGLNGAAIGATTASTGGFTTVAASGAITDTRAPAANTSIDGIILTDTTAASSGNQQYSPRVHFTGQGWKTTATAASQAVDMIEELQPVQGTTNPTGNLTWSSSVNGGAYSALMTLTSGGNVGIGTTSPSALLSVYGNSSAGQITLGSWVGAATENAIYLNGLSSTNGAYNLISSNADQNLYINRPSTKDMLFNENGGTQVIIKAGGNVGIGTATPNYKLDVNGTVNAPVMRMVKGSDLELGGDNNDEIRAEDNPSWFNAANTVTFKSYGGAFVFRDSFGTTNDMALALGGVAIGTTYASSTIPGSFPPNGLIVQGNVGIGTTTPGSALDVGVNGKIRASESSTHYLSLYDDGSAHLTGENTSNGGLILSSGIIEFRSSAISGSDEMYISGGNVGIGATGPSYLLDILNGAATGGSSLRITSNAQAESSIKYQGSSGDVWVEGAGGWGNAGSFTIGDATSGGVRLLIDSSGNVGIGTTSPSSLLDIESSATGNAPQIRLVNTAGGTGGSFGPGVVFLNDVASTHGFIAEEDQGSSSNFNIANSGSPYTDYLTITQLGNVGIGTTVPAAKLDVNGTVKLGASGVAVTAMGACTIASYTPTNTAANKTCTGVPASSSVAVQCSPSAAFTTPNTTVINARATGTVNQIAVNLSVANAVAVSLTCMWVQP